MICSICGKDKGMAAVMNHKSLCYECVCVIEKKMSDYPERFIELLQEWRDINNSSASVDEKLEACVADAKLGALVRRMPISTLLLRRGECEWHSANEYKLESTDIAATTPEEALEAALKEGGMKKYLQWHDLGIWLGGSGSTPDFIPNFETEVKSKFPAASQDEKGWYIEVKDKSPIEQKCLCKSLNSFCPLHEADVIKSIEEGKEKE